MATIICKDINDDFRLITLSGRLDVHGTEAIEKEFAALAQAGKRNIAADLGTVTFLSSVGIRMLIASAKALKEQGGRMVLIVGANDFAIKTLKSVCADSIMPMFEQFAQAEVFLKT